MKITKLITAVIMCGMIFSGCDFTQKSSDGGPQNSVTAGGDTQPSAEYENSAISEISSGHAGQPYESSMLSVLYDDTTALEIGYKTSREESASVSDDISPADVAMIKRLLIGLTPEFTDDAGTVGDAGYDSMYPLSSLTFSAKNKSAGVEFSDRNGRAYGRIWTAPAGEQKIVSDWFAADDTDLYVYALGTVLRTHDNGFYGVNQYDKPNIQAHTTACRIFSDDIFPGYTDTSTPDDYTVVGTSGEISLLLPEGGELVTYNNMLSWKKDGVALYVKDRFLDGLFEDTGIYDKSYVHFGSKIPGGFAVYDIYSPKEAGAWYINLQFRKDGVGQYSFSFRTEDEKLTNEFKDLAKYVLGSISVGAQQPYDAGRDHAGMRMNSSPSFYSDEGYLMVGASSDLYCNSVTEYVPQPFTISYYSFDRRKNYITKDYGYILEKNEDGKWYEVLPLSKIDDLNSGGEDRINYVFDNDAMIVVFDPTIYPLLPQGKYRVTVPFREEGENEETAYYGGFYEFEVTPAAEVPAHDGKATARLGKDGCIYYSISYPEIFYTGEYVDVEYYGDNGWYSVRTAPISSAKLSGHYSMDLFSHNDGALDAADYDLSHEGMYRLRISVYGVDDYDNRTGAPETIYAPLSVTL